MTREEAIKVLNMVEAHGLADEAKRMAIEALQSQDRILTQIEDIVLKEHEERREPDKCE